MDGKSTVVKDGGEKKRKEKGHEGTHRLLLRLLLLGLLRFLPGILTDGKCTNNYPLQR